MSDCAVREPGAAQHAGAAGRPGPAHGIRARRAGTADGAGQASWSPPDAARCLQLALGACWLLDAVLQYQSAMFTRAFPAMVAGTAHGNPAFVARPAGWAAGFIGQHPGAANALIAGVQLLLALGIAWRPTVRVALAASVAWALGVWWLGEGLGGVLTPAPTPVTGAPGAVILYALLAVLVWPRAGRDVSAPHRDVPSTAAPFIAAPFAAARPAGPRAARLLWSALWGALAYFALLPANRAPQALHDQVSTAAAGERGWLHVAGAGTAALLAQHGLAAAVILGAALATVAAGVWLPVPAARAAIVLAVLLAGVLWVIGQGLGGLLTGAATDPDTGPLLALLALAYWPVRSGAGPVPADAAHGAQGADGAAQRAAA